MLNQPPTGAAPALESGPLAAPAGEALAAALMQAALAIPAPAALASMRELAARLHVCEPDALPPQQRLAFWINLYNALVRYAFHSWQLRGSVLGNLRVFARAAWAIGGRRYSLDIIEHGLLRGNARVPPLKLFRTLGSRDARLRGAVSSVDPRIHFALNCGARSCPRLRVYRSHGLSEQLDAATREYFATHARLDQHMRRLRLPRLMKYFRRDFGERAAALDFAARYLEADQGRWVLAHAAQLRIDFTGYDWTILPVEAVSE